MHIAFTSAKPGQGVTVTTVLAAAALAKHRHTVVYGNEDTFAAAGAAFGDFAEPHSVDIGEMRFTNRDPGPIDGFVVCDGPVEGATQFLVTTGCYLALRRAVIAQRDIDYAGIVHIDQPGRAITGNDIEKTLDLEIVATIPWDSMIARAVDAGLLTHRRLEAERAFGNLASSVTI